MANGQPVADLKAEDLTVRVDGRPREIKSLELVTAATAPAAPAAAAAPAPSSAAKLPAPFDTNVVSGAPSDGPAEGVSS